MPCLGLRINEQSREKCARLVRYYVCTYVYVFSSLIHCVLVFAFCRDDMSKIVQVLGWTPPLALLGLGTKIDIIFDPIRHCVGSSRSIVLKTGF